MRSDPRVHLRPEHRLSTDTLKAPGVSAEASITYAYDLNDNETAKTTASTAGAAPNTYTRDQANRFTSWSAGRAPPATPTTRLSLPIPTFGALADLGDLPQQAAAGPPTLLAVAEHVLHEDPSVSIRIVARPVVRDVALVEQLHQMRA